MRFCGLCQNLHGALGRFASLVSSIRCFSAPMGRLSSSLLLYQPYWSLHGSSRRVQLFEARLHPVFVGSMGRWVPGLSVAKCSEVARIGLFLDTNQIRLAACTTLRCKKATCQHKFRKRCRQCASTVTQAEMDEKFTAVVNQIPEAFAAEAIVGEMREAHPAMREGIGLCHVRGGICNFAGVLSHAMIPLLLSCPKSPWTKI